MSPKELAALQVAQRESQFQVDLVNLTADVAVKLVGAEKRLRARRDPSTGSTHPAVGARWAGQLGGVCAQPVQTLSQPGRALCIGMCGMCNAHKFGGRMTNKELDTVA